jgi:hypothetical protein
LTLGDVVSRKIKTEQQSYYKPLSGKFEEAQRYAGFNRYKDEHEGSERQCCFEP